MSFPEIGEIVTLRSGGPSMTVVQTNGPVRTCGWFSYSSYTTMQADAGAFAAVGRAEESVDTVASDCIPRSVSASWDGTVEEFQVGEYAVVQAGDGSRTVTLDVVVPTNTAIDFMIADIGVQCGFVSDPEESADVAASYIDQGAIRYLGGTMVRIVRVAFAEPSL